MAGITTRIHRAAATHRRAAALAAAAGAVLGQPPSRPRAATEERGVRELAERLRVAAALLAPGWLGAPLAAVPATAPLGDESALSLVRIGTAYPLDDASFPVVLPLGHVAFDGDARDPRVAGVLRAVVLRLLATAGYGSLVVRAVDAAEVGFAPFAPLHPTGIMPPPATDRRGLQVVLAEAENWVRGPRPDRALLVAISSWPQETEASDRDRLLALAEAGPAAGLHLLVAGWPPPSLEGDITAPPLPHATQVALHNPYALVRHPPGGSFGAPAPPGEAPSAGLNAPVYLDEAPPRELVTRVCRELAAQVPRGSPAPGPGEPAGPSLAELLPEGPLWSQDAADGLAVAVGRRAKQAPLILRLADPTPHWLIGGALGSGKTTLLLTLLYGLCARYGPDQLRVVVLDVTGTYAGVAPHVRVVAGDGLAEELARRASVGEPPLPRVVCVVDSPPTEAAALLPSLAQQGGGYGVHLVLASQVPPTDPVAAGCRVRIALPGGSGVLDRSNAAAVGLPLGTALVNTAGGLGGPRGATRAHEQLVRFPHLDAEPATVAALRHRIWQAGGGTA